MSSADGSRLLQAARLSGFGRADDDAEVTVMPALTDAHVHLGLAPLPAGGSRTLGRVLDLGGDPAVLLRPSAPSPPAEVAPEAPGGTEVLGAGAFLTAVGGYPSTRAWAADTWIREVTGPADAAVAVAEQAGQGAAIIKVTLNAEAGPVLDEPTLAAVVGEAARRRLPVTAHVEGPGQAQRALAAGVRALAHTPWTERLSGAVLEAMAARTVWISTLDMHRRDGDDVAWETATANLRRFLACGGRAVYGTDLGNGLDVPELQAPEAEALISTARGAGLTEAEVLTAFTGAPLLPASTQVVSVLPRGIVDPGEALAALPHSRPVCVSALEGAQP